MNARCLFRAIKFGRFQAQTVPAGIQDRKAFESSYVHISFNSLLGFLTNASFNFMCTLEVDTLITLHTSILDILLLHTKDLIVNCHILQNMLEGAGRYDIL